ncbi:hypothetical protein [Streptomyces sp. Qhu_M48]|uniref:hypothetical protein n=1 Tax=Streptomyces sp. Qhu_M48 TaxID=3435889 RepID=UPI003F502578
MALLESRPGRVRRPVTLAGLSGYRAALAANSLSVAPVTAIDEITFTVDEELMEGVYSAYDSVEWDEL